MTNNNQTGQQEELDELDLILFRYVMGDNVTDRLSKTVSSAIRETLLTDPDAVKAKAALLARESTLKAQAAQDKERAVKEARIHEVWHFSSGLDMSKFDTKQQLELAKGRDMRLAQLKSTEEQEV